MVQSIQPRAQSQAEVGGAPAGDLSRAWQLGTGEPTGSGWVVAGLSLMRVTIYFLISIFPIPQLQESSQGSWIKSHILVKARGP